MQESDEILSLKATLKIVQEYENLFVEDYTPIVYEKLGILLKLVNTLHVDKVKLPDWEIWAEPILFKFSYHIGSFLRLYHGTDLPYKIEEKTLVIFDEPTISVLFRTILENYLTFYYLYSDSITDEEKKFRNLVWRYSGIVQRTKFEITNERAKEKQLKELEFAKTLFDEFSKSKCYSLYGKIKKDIKDGIKPRLAKSWKTLIKESNLRSDIFKNLYGYKSNYSHSEFISILQIHQGKYGFKERTIRGHYPIFLVHALIAKVIFELIEFFPTIEHHYNILSEKTKAELSALKKYCTN